MANRLAHATSPYLLQHKDNPVDWYEWGPEAFAAARERNVPIMLSVGYSACHWCHVMAHESFEDPDTAAYLNEHFVNVKVDREERPDIDAVYMEVTQAMTGSGGWPMTCFLTPTGEPFHAGTYFPPAPRHGMPSFRQVLDAVHRAWTERRNEVLAAGRQIVEQLTAGRDGGVAGPAPGPDSLATAVQLLERDFDSQHGGFGGAPKFPPAMAMEFLLRHAARTGSEAAVRMVDRTCEHMARGGIYDQLGGGFARYSVDNRWVVPHFEKMLYDNALLLQAYLHWWRLTGNPLGARIAIETADFCLREMRTPEGGFASALDADSEGVEGKFYVWTPAELRAVLGSDDGSRAAKLFGVTETGTFEHGTSTLQLLTDPKDPDWYAGVRERLFAARSGRVRPGRDDKVVASWNGLLVIALTEAALLLDNPTYLDAAVTAGELLFDLHLSAAGRLARTSKDGVIGAGAGVLEDYANTARAALALLSGTGDPVWLRRAEGLLDAVLERFSDGRGGFYDTADDAEQLIRRPRDPTDNVTPSGQSAAADALLTYAAVTGSARHAEAAEQALSVAGAVAERAPRAVPQALAVAEALVAGPLEIAVVGEPDDPDRRLLHVTALRSPSPGAVVVPGVPDPDGSSAGVPLLAHRDVVAGRPAAYVCRRFVCERPVTDAGELARSVGARELDHAEKGK